MAAYDAVPELAGQVMLTDTGAETELIFNQGVDLPLFAAFVLADDRAGADRIDRYHREHAAVALEHGLGVSLDAMTWRASSDWGAQLGYDAAGLDRVNHTLVARLRELRSDLGAGIAPVIVSGTVGPRSDGYAPTLLMTADEAASYHAPQLRSFVDAGADRACALTIGYAGEAIGIVAAATGLGMPIIIGFTVETDGRLPDGTSLAAAITLVDAQTDGGAAGYLINCAHPDHIAPALAGRAAAGERDGERADGDEGLAPWIGRLIGVRPNASRRSHAELDEATELDAGDPAEFGPQVAELRRQHPSMALLGGCCGTDVQHLRALAHSLRV